MDELATIVSDNNIEGVGMHIGNDTIITCAHVVNSALGLKQNAQEKPVGNGVIKVMFPYVSKIKKVRCQIVHWSPKPLDESSKTVDIAVLKMLEEFPQKIVPSKFSLIEKYENRNIKVLGFPKTFQNGAWASGKIDGKTTDGRYQISGDINPFASEVKPRFSGSPVIDKLTGEIIGILQARREDIGKRIYYMLPTQMIMSNYGQFGKYINHNPENDNILRKLWSDFKGVSKYTIKSSLSGVPLAIIIYALERTHTVPDSNNFILSDIVSEYSDQYSKLNIEESIEEPVSSIEDDVDDDYEDYDDDIFEMI